MTTPKGPPPRASCVRCNALLDPELFDSEWRFGRCACGATSVLPQRVQSVRPAA